MTAPPLCCTRAHRHSRSTIWSYAHVPFGYTGDATEAVINQIERFAPGFRDRIIATVSKSTAELQAYNPNYIGGDTIGGTNDRLQMLFRPRVAIDPPSRRCAGWA